MNNPLLWIDPWGLCRSITNDSKLFSDAIATDPIRFSQSSYIPLSYEQVSKSHHFELNYSLSSYQNGNTRIDAFYINAEAHIDLSTLTAYARVDVGGAALKTSLLDNPYLQISGEARFKSAQFELGIYNLIPGYEAYLSTNRLNIVNTIEIPNSGVSLEAAIYGMVGSIGGAAKYNPVTGGFSHGSALGYGGGYNILIKKNNENK